MEGRGRILALSFILLSSIFASLFLRVVSTASTTSTSTSNGNGENEAEVYGVDHSWPIHHGYEKSVLRNKRYEDYMNGCYGQGYDKYEKRADGMYQSKDDTHDAVRGAGAGAGAGADPNNNDEKTYVIEQYDREFVIACNKFERDRLEMNLNQPKLMENYTHSGYAKVKISKSVLEILQQFMEQNERYLWPEFWDEGNTYVNHWSVPTMLLDIGRKDVPKPLTSREYETIIKSVQNKLESWTNQRLVLTSSYGIRAFGEGSILAPHVDRLPLVSSAIINVFQRNVAEPWVLEVIGHDGIAHNLTSELGEMIFYESASVIHGRPYPLTGKGALYGSIFLHFEPLYHTMRHAHQVGDQYAGAKTKKDVEQASKLAFDSILQDQLKKPSLRQLQNEESEIIQAAPNGNKIVDTSDEKMVAEEEKKGQKIPFRITPRYVWPEYDALYDQRFYYEYEETATPKTSKTVFGKITAHQAASLGELSSLKEIAKTQGKNELFKADHNGWRPIHEAARSGHADVLEYLLEEGANANERTNNNRGGNPLYWANRDRKNNAKAITILQKYGAVSMAPIDKQLLKQFGEDKDGEGNKANSDTHGDEE